MALSLKPSKAAPELPTEPQVRRAGTMAISLSPYHEDRAPTALGASTEIVGMVDNTTIYAVGSELWASTPHASDRPNEYALVGLSYIDRGKLRKTGNFSPVVEPISAELLKAHIEKRCLVTGAEHRPRKAWPAVRGFETVQDVEALLAAHHAVIRDGRLLSPTPRILSRPAWREALDVYLDVLVARAAGDAIACDQKRCSEPATHAVVGGIYCKKHAAQEYPAAQAMPKPVDWWTLPRVSLTRAGAKLIGLPAQPEAAPQRI